VKNRVTAGSVAFDTLLYIFFGLFTLICVFPFYYIFINTVSANDLSARGLVVWYPKGIHFGNFLEVLKLQNLPNAALISLSRTVIGTFLSVLCTSFLGFALSRKEMWARKFCYRFFIATMYFNAGIIPWYITMQNLKLTNNFLAYIIPGMVGAFNLILVKTYIESIPDSLDESAEIDGAGYMSRFFRIILPLSKPIIATIAVFTAVGHWNSYLDTLILMRSQKLFTLQFVLWQYLNQANSAARILREAAASGRVIAANPAAVLTTTTVKMTIAMVVTLPILIVYPFFQRYFVKGIMIGAVKG